MVDILFTFCIYTPPDQTFFETSAIVLTLIILGRYLEALAQTKACNVLQTIDDQQAKTALLILKSTAGDEEAIQNDVNGCSSREICTELIQIGDIIKVSVVLVRYA